LIDDHFISEVPVLLGCILVISHNKVANINSTVHTYIL